MSEANDIIAQGLANGGAQNEEFLDSLGEYDELFSKAGYSAQEFVNIINTGYESGIYADKLPDALKEADLALKTNINKLNIADTLIKNEKLKNVILNNIAFTYLLEDQNMAYNQEFLKTYHKYSTDKSQKNEINKIGNAIQSLKVGNDLPEVELLDANGKVVSSKNFAAKNTVIFFWTSRAKSHFEAVHKKIVNFNKQYPNYQFIAINLNDSEEQWKKILSSYKFVGTTELHASDFENIKYKWAINKIHRTIILDKNGKIKNAFANIFDSQFEDNLK